VQRPDVAGWRCRCNGKCNGSATGPMRPTEPFPFTVKAAGGRRRSGYLRFFAAVESGLLRTRLAL
jgi:hypothetical protein